MSEASVSQIGEEVVIMGEWWREPKTGRLPQDLRLPNIISPAAELWTDTKVNPASPAASKQLMKVEFEGLGHFSHLGVTHEKSECWLIQKYILLDVGQEMDIQLSIIENVLEAWFQTNVGLTRSFKCLRQILREWERPIADAKQEKMKNPVMHFRKSVADGENACRTGSLRLSSEGWLSETPKGRLDLRGSQKPALA